LVSATPLKGDRFTIAKAVGADYDIALAILLGEISVAAIREQFAASLGNHFFDRNVRVETRHLAFSWVASYIGIIQGRNSEYKRQIL
jgi:hypothetical protein